MERVPAAEAKKAGNASEDTLRTPSPPILIIIIIIIIIISYSVSSWKSDLSLQWTTLCKTSLICLSALE